MAQVVVVMGVTTDVPLGLSACMVSVRDHQHMEYGANSLIRNSSVLEMCKSEANNMEVYEGHDSQALDTIDPGLREISLKSCSCCGRSFRSLLSAWH
jgi:hypothetical protein